MKLYKTNLNTWVAEYKSLVVIADNMPSAANQMFELVKKTINDKE